LYLQTEKENELTIKLYCLFKTVYLNVIIKDEKFNETMSSFQFQFYYSLLRGHADQNMAQHTNTWKILKSTHQYVGIMSDTCVQHVFLDMTRLPDNRVCAM